MRARGFSSTAFALAASLALAGLVAGPTQAAPGTLSPSAVNQVAAGLATQGKRSLPRTRTVVAQDSEHGNFVVREDEYGSTLTWKPDEELPMGDARPEFFLNGHFLGAPVSKGELLTLRVPGLLNAEAKDLSTVSGGRVLDGKALAPAKKKVRPVAPSQPKSVIKTDPGIKGKYSTESFTYKQKSIKVPGYATKVEMRGLVVAPKGAPGKRPVVLFLHGRHGTCYSQDGADLAWPCDEGTRSIPSYRGYADQQKLLASQGYITVSISANSINAQDAEFADAGSGARALLVREHLALLANWNERPSSVPKVKRVLRGRMNLNKVMTVGHSRGGEGVNRAALQAKKGDKFKIVGQVLIAPTDFGRQVSVGTPTTVVLPYCDGDVSDLQGQQYVDQGATIAKGDSALRTSVLLMGANHNYFNTQWTPGLGTAPAEDDWWDESDPVCGARSKQRLSSTEQRAASATYVAAAARSYLTKNTTAVKLLDGTPVRAKSAGRAIALTSAVLGKRRAILRPTPDTKLSVKGKASAKVCDGFTVTETGRGACSTNEAGSSPHWLPVSYGDTEAPSPKALRFVWKKAGARVKVRGPRDLGTYRNVDLRVITEPNTPAARFNLVLRDTSGRSVTLKTQGALMDLPVAGYETHLWAQTVRFVLPKTTKVNLRKIESMSLVGTSTRGRIYVLDAHAASSGLRASSATNRNVAKFDVQDAVVKRDPAQAEQTGYVSVPVTNTFVNNAKVWVEVSDLSTYSGYSGRAYTVRPGQRELKVPVKFAGDDLFVDDEYADASGYSVSVRALRNAVVDKTEGGLSVRNSAPRPTLTVDQPDVVAGPGGVVRWTLQLSAPMAQSYDWFATAVAPSISGPELMIGSAAPSWVKEFIWDTSGKQTFSEADVMLPITINAFSTRTTIEIPIRSLAQLGDGQNLELLIEPDGTFITEPISLRARIEP